MIDRFESVARAAPLREFLAFIDAEGKEETLTYREARLISAAIALRLRQRGVGRTSWVALDLPNCPEFILMLLAAAYGPFQLVLLDAALSPSEKSARLRALAADGVTVQCVIDAERAAALWNWAEALLEDGAEVAEGVDDGFQAPLYGAARGNARDIGLASGSNARERGGVSGSNARGFGDARTSSARDLSRAEQRNDGSHRRPIFSDQQDALDDVIHFAEQVHRSFDETAPALIMFSTTSSTSPRAVMLRWHQLRSTATASMQRLRETGESLTQIVMSLGSIQGISMVTRAIVAGHGLRLYRRFDATRVLWDVVMFKVTHLTADAAMLKSLLAADDHGALRGLECLLIDGRALKPTLAERALDAHIPMFVSFGCPEVAGLAAVSPLRAEDNGGLALLEGVRVRILEPDSAGYGALAITGPGLFGGYLSGRTPFTVDGFFLTGDRAALSGGALFVRERASEAFVCGGEVVSLEEIERTLAHVPGVWDVHVMDVRDEKLGRRPVALIERAPGVGSELTINSLRPLLGQCFSPMTMPKHLCFTEELPASGDGSVDLQRASELYRRRIEVKTVKIVRPSPALLKVILNDDCGRVGVGEIALQSASDSGAFGVKNALEPGMLGVKSASDPEALGVKSASDFEDASLERALSPRERAEGDAPVSDVGFDAEELEILRSTLAPMLVNEAFLHPREVTAALLTSPSAAHARHAATALEMACWDLYARIVGKSIGEVFASEFARLFESATGTPRGRLRMLRTSKARDAEIVSIESCGGVEPTIARIAEARAGGRPVRIAPYPGVATERVRAALTPLLA